MATAANFVLVMGLIFPWVLQVRSMVVGMDDGMASASGNEPAVHSAGSR